MPVTIGGMRKLLVALSAAAAVVSMTAPVLAHEGDIGDGGPFKVRVDSSTLPEGVELRLGNGELELHVPAGIELVAIGVENEPMAKVDADGNMFGNKNSPTWWMSLDGGMGTPPADLDLNAAPDWEWVKGGGSLQYHDHRIHFMAPSIAESIADGGDVFSFSLPFLVDGAEAAIAGALVFDPTLDPAAAARLRDGNGSMEMPMGDQPMNDMTASMVDMQDTESSSLVPVIVIVGIALGAVVATALFLRRKN